MPWLTRNEQQKKGRKKPDEEGAGDVEDGAGSKQKGKPQVTVHYILLVSLLADLQRAAEEGFG